MHSNSTEFLHLPQWDSTDIPSYLGDFNGAFADIDRGVKANADAIEEVAENQQPLTNQQMNNLIQILG